jgi:hypothetical protein
MKINCRVVSHQFQAETWDDFEMDGICYSGRTPLAAANALVALYDPTEELLTFRGPKVWFTMEPSWHHHFTRDSVGRRLIASLRPDEHLWFGNPDLSFRVPHPTFRKNLAPVRSDAQASAVACVSNFGGRCWFLKSHIQLRNRFILSDRVELYGNPNAWKNFRWFPQLWRKEPPNNFKGSAPGKNIHDLEFRKFLSAFKVAVCLENQIEPHYFTEKFVNAARAGCIPVYHAHPSVRDSFLKGAKWVDPINFDFCPRRTIDYALSEPLTAYTEANDAWLQSGILDATDDQMTFKLIHNVLREKIANQS